MSPHPGAICTIPVPSPATTISFPRLSFPGSTTLCSIFPQIPLSANSSFLIGYPPSSDCASKSSNGALYFQSTISLPRIFPTISYPPLSLNICEIVFSLGSPSSHCFLSLYCLSSLAKSRFSSAK